MSLFSVDTEKCKGDGICAAECPAHIIVMGDGHACPEPADGADELCIHCGHCVAVCPHGALSHQSMSPDQCPPLRKDWLPDARRVEHFLRSRRSIRTYREQPVNRELIEKLIDIARYAPSGHNTQPVRWLVISGREEVNRLAGLVVDWMRHLYKEQREFALSLHMDRIIDAWERGVDSVCRAAPHLIVAHAPKDDRTAPAACTIALAHLELAAPSFGLGVCWAGYFNAAASVWPPLREVLELPQGHASLGALMIGFPKYTYYRLPLRNAPVITWR